MFWVSCRVSILPLWFFHLWTYCTSTWTTGDRSCPACSINHSIHLAFKFIYCSGHWYETPRCVHFVSIPTVTSTCLLPIFLNFPILHLPDPWLTRKAIYYSLRSYVYSSLRLHYHHLESISELVECSNYLLLAHINTLNQLIHKLGWLLWTSDEAIGVN